MLRVWRRGVALASLGYQESNSKSSPVSTGMGDRLWVAILSRYVASQLGQLSPATL